MQNISGRGGFPNLSISPNWPKGFFTVRPMQIIPHETVGGSKRNVPGPFSAQDYLLLYKVSRPIDTRLRYL